VSESTIKKLGEKDYEKIYIFPNSHAGYYPGAKMIGMKVIFRKSDGRLLGAQALGHDGPAVDIPLPQLRARLGELPRDREIHIFCRSAQRAYYATRILLQNGFKARNLSGGTLARAMHSLGELKYGNALRGEE
jgi:rhodanese-related sulfurtransferase